jgi:hypothetical protein
MNLNQTRIFGSVCEHGFPILFINVQHGGEEMIFASKIVDELLKGQKFGDFLLKHDSICCFEPYRIVRFLTRALNLE